MLNLNSLRKTTHVKLSRAKRIYIHLGRTGDAIASLPILWLHYKETGEKAALMVAREFSSFLEGVSYVIPEIWPGDFKDVAGAKARARMMGYKEILVPQIYGYGLRTPHTQSSFIKESWKQVGRLKDWGAPLIFDNRNFAREQALVSKLPTGKPIILVATSGHSAPFPYNEDLFKSLREWVGDKAHVVDLADFKSDHFHDFLGLIDAAACFVTGDTGFGQLAQASKTPVCALIAYQPTLWHSSPPRPNHACYIRYNEYNAKKTELKDAVLRSLWMLHKPTIRHVWAGVRMSPEGNRRMDTAAQTWKREATQYGPWQEFVFSDSWAGKSAQDLGDPAKLPYIHDMLDVAALGAEDNEILIITNADISFVPGLASEIAHKCHQVGAVYCHRWDFPRVETHISRDEIIKGKWYVGCDLFAMTVGWWKMYRHELPPFVIGRECWDWVFRELINQTGGCQIERGIYHEKHASPWEANRGLAGNLHNRSYARAWLEHNGIDLAEITNQPHFKVDWPPLRT